MHQQASSGVHTFNQQQYEKREIQLYSRTHISNQETHWAALKWHHHLATHNQVCWSNVQSKSSDKSTSLLRQHV